MKIRAWVWWCGDDWCNCTEARIEIGTPGPPGRLFPDWTIVWRGEFYTDGELGADAELERVAAAMREHWPAAYAAIEWPAHLAPPSGDTGGTT